MSSLDVHGKCKEMSEELCKLDNSLSLVRGFYYCPFTNSKYSHWWTVDKKGNINDPTKMQFLSKGMGDYIPLDGYCKCDECGKKVLIEDTTFYGKYTLCSYECYGKFVGF